VLADVDVVEPHDGEVLGHAQPELPRGAQDADRHRVRHREHACGPEAILPGAPHGRDAALDAGRRDHDRVVGQLQATGGERGHVAAHAASGHAIRLGLGAGRRRLNAHHQDVPVAEAQEVVRGGSGTTLVVDLDTRLVRQGARVHHHQRHAGGADLLHLGVTGSETDDDHAVHRGPAHRAGERAVERRDEVEGVAFLFGRQGNALAEGPEEGVREDHRQRLRGQHPQGMGAALGEHARNRVRAITEGIGNPTDPDRRLRRQPIRAVERERDSRLRHARLAGDVGDARPSRVAVLQGLLAVACRPSGR
jgi:hypothetical protein